MEANAGLVAGSYKRNELVRIRHDSDSSSKPGKNLNGQICQICGDTVGLTATGDVFVACNECAFPVCRPCYEYERKDGNQACPQCKTRYKRHKGSPRVDGDDDEDDIDDLENEFNYAQGTSNARRQWQGEDADLSSSSRHESQQPIPLLTNGQSVSGEIPCATPDNQSVRTTSGPLDPRQPVPVRIVDPSKDLNSYGLGNVDWKERVEGWKLKQDKNMMQMTSRYAEGKGDMEGTGSNGEELQMADDARQPLSRIVPISSSHLTPYRVVIILRLIILGFFLQYRATHPVKDAYPLWLTSVICEIWFALSWLLDQFPKWFPINRETYLDRLTLRYDRDGEPSQLAPIDVFVSTVDPMKEPPLVTANTVLSILSVDYPVDKVSCYVSDDGSAMLTFESLSETAEFARKWVPFCKKHNIEPRAPEFYFAQKIDYLKDKIQPSFVKERRAMKREYEEFKVRINALVAKAQKMPEEGWTMQDGTPWPGNNPRDHPGMIQVFLGHSGGLDTDGNELPRLVYVSREKRPGFQHHKKAGAMNALERVNAKLNLWREVLEPKGLRLSRSKTEYMECKFNATGGPIESGVRIGDQELPKSDRFRYLGSILQKNGDLDGDLNHRIQAGWMKWKSASGVLCDRRMPLKLKGKFYRTAIRPALLYGTEYWAVKHQHVHKMGVAEMRMLRWMCGHTRRDKIRNEEIRGKVGVAEIEGKMRENRLRWFGHVQRRPTNAPVRRCDYGTEVQGRRGRGRPRKTLEETLRKDLEYLDLTDDMTQDRAQWRSRIHIADPT